MAEETPTFVIRSVDGATSFEFVPSDDLWIDMQAFAAASGQTVDAIVKLALARLFQEASHATE
jgi:hypothetical protein